MYSKNSRNKPCPSYELTQVLSNYNGLFHLLFWSELRSSLGVKDWMEAPVLYMKDYCALDNESDKW